MKKLLFLVFALPFFTEAQNYVDLLEVGYGQTFNNDFEGTPSSTQIKTVKVDFTFPVVLNENYTLITGVLFNKSNLQLYPDNDFDIFIPGVDDQRFASLYSTTLKLGLAITINDKWSTTLVALPKIASDYINIDSDDFYLGGVALFKVKKSEHLTYKFGVYSSSEAFGFFTTPIFGWYYLSPNSKFEMDVSLPIAADINYTTGDLTYGFDYVGIGRSFRLHNKDIPGSLSYVDLSSLEFASYIQYNALKKSILLRAKFGYSSSNYEVYPTDDKIDLGLSAFSFGDDRAQLNPDISGGLFLKFEAIYRFNLSEKTEPKD